MLKTSNCYTLARFLSVVVLCLLFVSIGYGKARVHKSGDETPIVLNISGQTSFCYSTNFTTSYSVTNLSTGTFTWTVPANCTIMSGQGTNTISVRFNSASMSMGISVTNAGNGGGISIAAYTPTSGAGIVGPSTVCAGQTGVAFSATGSPTTLFSWNPGGAGISFPSGSSGQTTSVNFASNFTGGSINVTIVNGPCVTSASKTVSRASAVPSAGTINGSSTVCMAQSNVSYTASISNATGYVWSVPSGATIVSGANTSSITVNFPVGTVNGNVSVYGTNCVGNGASTNFPVTISTSPEGVGQIVGQNGVCESGTYSYSVTPVANATGYGWIGSGGPTAFTASGAAATCNFMDNYPTAGVTIMVYAMNSCGIGPTSKLDVKVFKKPAAASAITGPLTVCSNRNDIVYSVNPVTNAIGYSWGVPPGMTIVSGSNTNSIIVNTGPTFYGGSIHAQGVDGACGTGPGSAATLALPAQAPASLGSITETLNCPNVVYSVPSVFGVNYQWTIPSGATIISGANTNSITLNYLGGSTGQVSVVGSNCIGNGPASVKNVTAISIPDAAGIISGSQSVCPVQYDVQYSVPAINGATGYVWTLPSGATIATGQNTNAITVNYVNASTGSITVYGVNCGGSGQPSAAYPIAVLPIPGSAGPIRGETVTCDQTSVFSIDPVEHASTYTWSVPIGATIVSGQGTTSVSVSFSGESQWGKIYVTPGGCNAAGAFSYLVVNTSEGTRITNSVDNVTGTMTAALPLFSVTDGDVSVPISLSYSATGVKVIDDDGWVGQNWAISTESLGIFREMRGLPDDYLITTQPDPLNPDNRKGWLNGAWKGWIDTFSPQDAAACTDEVADFNSLNAINYDQDTEPDAFHVILPGQSFDFYFDKNNVPQVLPYTDVVVTPNTTVGPISSFMIKDASGVEYQFNEIETVTENIYETSPSYFVRLSHMHIKPFTYTTGWRLTKITSPVYGSVSFTYNPIQVNADARVPSNVWISRPGSGRYLMLRYVYNYALITTEPDSPGGGLGYYRISNLKVPARIIAPSMEVEFVSTKKSPGSVVQRLNTINLYEKRVGGPKLVRSVDIWHLITGQRAFISDIFDKVGCVESRYHMDYNANPALPDYSSANKDAWDLYKDPQYQYDETAPAGSLRKITQPLQGYTVFFYETHDYWNGTTDVQGGGIRVKKIIDYDAVSSDHDIVQEFTYKTAAGHSSGKLQDKNALSFSVAEKGGLHFDETTRPGDFTITGNQKLSPTNMLNGSAVAYERVRVKTLNAGYSVYEYDLPASYQETTANSNEWTASKVRIARQSAPVCLEKANIQLGYDVYPFPANPTYNFARGLLKKVTDFNDADVKVHDVVYGYQRLYKGTGIDKIYGLCLEELPTYYVTTNSNNVVVHNERKLFVYSKYELFTNVKIEMSTKTETLYNSIVLAQNSQVTTSYDFTSPYHRQLTSVTTQNSGGTSSVVRMKYVQDFQLTSPSAPASIALKGLYDSRRFTTPIETTSSKVINGAEKILGASVTLFQTSGPIVYPYQQYQYVSNDGNGGFIPASVTGSTFTFDNAHYVLKNTLSNFDAYGNASTSRDGSKDFQSVAYGYNGTLPIVTTAHAALSEIRYSDFETSSPADFFVTWPSPLYQSDGIDNSRDLYVPAGKVLISNLVANRSPWYVFSGYVKGQTGGTLTLLIQNLPYTFNFTGGGGWTKCDVRIPVSLTATNINVTLSSDVDVMLDNLALYPESADVMFYTYKIPFGKASEKDARGNAMYYDYDIGGRLKVIYDRDRNVIKKYDYQIHD